MICGEDPTAQVSYGETTRGAFQRLVTKLQSIADHWSEDPLAQLPFGKEEYNLTSKSTFLDIGSGFGKPVFHASLQTNCQSMGIEVQEVRVFASNDLKYFFTEEEEK